MEGSWHRQHQVAHKLKSTLTRHPLQHQLHKRRYSMLSRMAILQTPYDKKVSMLLLYPRRDEAAQYLTAMLSSCSTSDGHPSGSSMLSISCSGWPSLEKLKQLWFHGGPDQIFSHSHNAFIPPTIPSLHCYAGHFKLEAHSSSRIFVVACSATYQRSFSKLHCQDTHHIDIRHTYSTLDVVIYNVQKSLKT